MEDKTLVCQDCGAEFVFTVGEQEFYKEKENSLPEDQETSSRTVPNGI